MNAMMGSIAGSVARIATSACKVTGTILPQKRGNRILMYHAVGTNVHGDVRGLYNIPPERFESHMRILASFHRDHIKSLDIESICDEGSGIMITFDDGYRDNLITAAPLLVQLGIPFTVFVTTGPMLAGDKDRLSHQDLCALHSLPGVKIGAHGVSHARLAGCGNLQLKEELSKSKACLEEILQFQVDALSYPHGSVDGRVRDAAAEAGFRIGATSRFDTNVPGRDLLLLCRTDIWATDSDKVFKEKLAGYWDWRRWRHPDPARR